MQGAREVAHRWRGAMHAIEGTPAWIPAACSSAVLLSQPAFLDPTLSPLITNPISKEIVKIEIVKKETIRISAGGSQIYGPKVTRITTESRGSRIHSGKKTRSSRMLFHYENLNATRIVTQCSMFVYIPKHGAWADGIPVRVI